MAPALGTSFLINCTWGLGTSVLKCYTSEGNTHFLEFLQFSKWNKNKFDSAWLLSPWEEATWSYVNQTVPEWQPLRGSVQALRLVSLHKWPTTLAKCCPLQNTLNRHRELIFFSTDLRDFDNLLHVPCTNIKAKMNLNSMDCHFMKSSNLCHESLLENSQVQKSDKWTCSRYFNPGSLAPLTIPLFQFLATKERKKNVSHQQNLLCGVTWWLSLAHASRYTWPAKVFDLICIPLKFTSSHCKPQVDE